MKRTRTNWTKKATILLAAICVALVAMSAFTPSGAQAWLLQVEGAPVSRAVYSYFLSQAVRDARQNGQLNPDGSPKDLSALRKDVAARCVEHVAVNSELRAMGVPIDQTLKAQAADRTAFYWQMFGRYYRAAGVDKQTLNAVLTGQSARDQLFRALYDTGGARPTSEEALQAYFYGNFVAYEGVRVFLTALWEDGTERDMTDQEKADLKADLEDLVTAANEAEDFYSVAQEERFAKALSYMAPTPAVMDKSAGEVSEEDFEKVRSLPRDKISLLELEGFLLVATGIDMRESEDEYYLGYRSACLWTMQGEAYAKALEELCAQFHADENVGALDKFYREWNW